MMSAKRSGQSGLRPVASRIVSENFTGNFGDICAGHIARQMGVPIDRLIVATNENDVLDEFFHTGAYRVRSAAETQATSSPSMDISRASNFERFIFDLLGRDAERTADLFGVKVKEGGHDVKRRWHLYIEEALQRALINIHRCTGLISAEQPRVEPLGSGVGQ